RLILIVGVHVVSLIANRETDVVDLIADALDVPHQMNPCICREGLAVVDSGFPAVHVIPDIPLAGVIEAALRSPDPAFPAESLIDIELERLRGVRVVN